MLKFWKFHQKNRKGDKMKKVRQEVGSYLDETRPGRQRFVQNVTVVMMLLFVAFVYVRSKIIERFDSVTNVYGAVDNANSVNKVRKNVSDKTSSEVDQYQCSLPGEFPAPEYQYSWDKILSHCEAIENSSVQWGFEPELIASIIMIESGGESSAISQSGAIGLMQIMSSDGLSGQLYGDYFSNRPTVIELLDPRFNIEWGTSFLASLLKSYGDNIREALFHYGPTNVGYEDYADKVLSVYNLITDAN